MPCPSRVPSRHSPTYFWPSGYENSAKQFVQAVEKGPGHGGSWLCCAAAVPSSRNPARSTADKFLITDRQGISFLASPPLKKGTCITGFCAVQGSSASNQGGNGAKAIMLGDGYGAEALLPHNMRHIVPSGLPTPRMTKMFKLIAVTSIAALILFSGSAWAQSIDRGLAFSAAVSELGARAIVALALFLILTIGIIKGPRATPTQTARWVGAFAGACSLLALPNPPIASTKEFFAIHTVLFIFFYFLSFLVGFVWRIMRPLKVAAIGPQPSAKNSTITPTESTTPDEKYWAAALFEFDAGERRAGLWARVFSEAQGNEAQAKASYLKVRAAELRDIPLETDIPCFWCGTLNPKGAKKCKGCKVKLS